MARRTLASDNFNRANGTLPDDGAPWKKEQGSVSFVISSNGITLSANNDITMRYNASFPDDQWAQITFTQTETASGAQAGVALRVATGAATLYRIVVDGSGNFEIGRFISGSHTTIDTFTSSVANGDVLRAEIVGSTIKVYINGTQVRSVNDSNISSGAPGMAFSGTGAPSTNTKMDDFSAGDFVNWLKVQSRTANNPTSALAFLSNVTAGNLLVAEYGEDALGMTVTDNTGHNVWAQVKEQADSLNDQVISMWYAIAQQTEACSVSGDFAHAFKTLIIHEWTYEPGGTITLDQNAGSNPNSGNPVSGSITPTAADALVLAACYNQGAINVGNEVESPFVYEDKANDAAGDDAVMASYIQSTPASVSCTWNYAAGAQACTVIGSFIVAASTPPVTNEAKLRQGITPMRWR